MTVYEQHDAKEYKIPGVLLGLGFLVYVLHVFLSVGKVSIPDLIFVLALVTFLQVVLGVISCLITVKIIGASFGNLTPTILKLAAIFVVTGAIVSFIPFIGWIVGLFLYWVLAMWLFELETIESLVLVVVMWLLSMVINFVIFALYATALHHLS